MKVALTKKVTIAACILFCALLAAALPAPDPGDTDGNGRVDYEDAIRIQEHLLGLLILTNTADANSNNTIDISDVVTIINVVLVSDESFGLRHFFPTASPSHWQMSDQPERGDDGGGFTWTIDGSTIRAQGGRQAIRMKTTTANESDPRNGGEDFWFVDPNGDLVYCGFHQPRSLLLLPPQDVLLDEPIVIGTDSMNVGDSTKGSSTAQILSVLDLIEANVTSSVELTRFVTSVRTPMGTFSTVLRMSISLDLTASTPLGDINLPIRSNTFFLKKGVGLVSIDSMPDPNDAGLEVLVEGVVGGKQISPDAP